MQDEYKKLFISKYNSFGTDKFYKFLLNYAINKVININENDKLSISPEIELMEYYDKFLVLYRREDDLIYLDIAKLFRRAANKVYRILLKKNMTDKNSKFFNLVA